MSAAREAAVGVVRLLRGRGHVAYFAGGCVRDELLGFEPEDYDVATDATPEEVKLAHGSVSEVGASFGVMLVREMGRTIEVATFRTEGVYSDKRRPDAVEYADAPSDARRRDFTINAMFLDPLADPTVVEIDGTARRVRGEVLDYVGGVADLASGVIRAVGDPEQRLAEDHLRALRAVRFAARLGFSIDVATASAIREHARDLEGVSEERVGEEVRRMLEGADRARAVGLMNELGLDGPALRDGLCAGVGGRLERLDSRAGVVAAMAVWASERLEGAGVNGPGWDGEAVSGLVRSWRASLSLSNETRDGLRGALLGAGELVEGFFDAGVARQKRMACAGWFEDAVGVLGCWDEGLAARIRERVEGLSGLAGGLSPVAFLDGRDLLELGCRSGPAIGRVLGAMYDLQLSGGVTSREMALERARGLIEEDRASQKGAQPKRNRGV